MEESPVPAEGSLLGRLVVRRAPAMVPQAWSARTPLHPVPLIVSEGSIRRRRYLAVLHPIREAPGSEAWPSKLPGALIRTGQAG
jgi:hypothetical protein